MAPVAVLQKAPISNYLSYLRARGPLLISDPFVFLCAICGVGEGHDAPVLSEKLFDRKTHMFSTTFFKDFAGPPDIVAVRTS